MLFVTVIILSLFALALDFALTGYAQHEMQAALDAAALAGAAEAFRLPQPGEPRLTVHERARMAAARSAASNVAKGDRVMLESDDILVAPAVEQHDAERDNLSVLIQPKRGPAVSGPVTRWLGQRLGLVGFAANASARAEVNQRIAGFRPADDARVPFAPVVVLRSLFFNSQGRPVSVPRSPVEIVSPAPSATDRYAVDSRTQRVFAGADGQPEFEIRLRLAESRSPRGTDEAEAVGIVHLTGLPYLPEQLVAHVLHGYGAEDLGIVGGRLELEAHGTLTVPIVQPRRAETMQAAAAAFAAIRGQPRVWLLARNRSSAGASAGLCELAGFAAASVADVRLDRDSTLAVVLQPCRLLTSTARTRDEGPRNPWIGKVALVP